MLCLFNLNFTPKILSDQSKPKPRGRVNSVWEQSRPDSYLPVVEDRQGEGLALCVRAQVGLEAKRVDGRDEGLDGVEGRAWDGSVLGDMTPAG